jgi:hypothetical protein
LRFLVPPDQAQIAYDQIGVRQFIQLLGQKEIDLVTNFFNYLYGLKPMPPQFQEALASLADSFRYLNSDETTASHVKDYMRHLIDGDSILVVAHSQGNFYMDAAFRILESQGYRSGYGSVMVATPLQSAPPGIGPYFSEGTERGDGDWYTTLKSDLVIAHWALTLPANTSNSQSGILDHYFIDPYLTGDVSGPKILKQIACALSRQYEEIKDLASDPANLEKGEGYWTPERDACKSISGR